MNINLDIKGIVYQTIKQGCRGVHKGKISFDEYFMR